MSVHRRRTRGRAAINRIFCCIICIIVASAPSVADAFVYTDIENEIRIFIPENEHTYYYTPDQTNLFEDLMEQVQSTGQDVRVLVRVYSDTDRLGYSLQINALPLSGAPPEQGEAPEGSNLRDATLLTSDEQNAAAQTIRDTYGTRFNFSEPRASSFNGIPAIEMDGTGVADTAWAEFDCSAYILAAQDHLITITLVVENSGLYRNAGVNMLNAVEIGANALAEPTSAATVAETAEPEPSSATPEASAALETPTPTVTAARSASVAGFMDMLQPALPLICAAAAVIVILAIALRRRKSRQAEQQQSAQTEPEAHDQQIQMVVAAEPDAGASDATTRSSASLAEHVVPAHDEEATSTTSASSPESPADASEIVDDVDIVDTLASEATNETSAADKSGSEQATGESVVMKANYDHDSFGDTRPFSPAGLGDTIQFRPIRDTVDSTPDQLPDAPAQDETEMDTDNVSYATDSVRSDKEDSTMTSDSRYIANGHDYTEDVSRYTQQPSADVNDVSRYTHGVGASADDDLQSLKDMPAERRTPRPSVGSRVERNKRRRKK